MKNLKQNISTLILIILIITFISIFIIVRVFIIMPKRSKIEDGKKEISKLLKQQEGQSELLDKINVYKDGLYSLSLVLDARKNIKSGSDEENPYLVFDYFQVLNDLRRLLPKDAKALQFQVNNKGLLTMPIESVDYASLGRVLRSFKDADLFTNVLIPSGVQMTKKQEFSANGLPYFKPVYNFVLQAQLNPAFWQDFMPFADVERTAYYAQAIRDLYISGSIEGYNGRYFKPNNSINRAEFFKIALFEFMSNDTISVEEYNDYIDYTDNDWRYKYVKLATKMGLNKEGDYKPEQTITRIEALKTIMKIFKLEPEDVELSNLKDNNLDSESNENTDENADNNKDENRLDFSILDMPFEDVRPDSDIYPIIRLAIDNNLLDKEGRKFRPNENVSRAEVAYWVWKIKFDYLD